jgi:hypothetical protein
MADASVGSSVGSLHHLEIWVPHLERAVVEWGWLLAELGYLPFQRWAKGCSWKLGSAYIVVEQSTDLTSTTHRRTDAGMNHVAFHAGTRENVDRLRELAVEADWFELYADKYPHAGGPEHYAAFLINSDGYEVELVAE